MDRRIEECPALTTEGREFLHRVEAGLALTADVSRADVLLCCLHSSRQALVASHASPRSIASLYPQDATGRLLDPEDQPLLMRALRHGVGGHRQHEVESSNAPIIQYVHPVCDRTGRTLGALLVETNLFAHERHRRRHHGFRQAVDWLQQMAARGELACAGELSRFGLYDGVYLVDRNRYVTYMSGIASNLFRSVGFTDTLQGRTGSSGYARRSRCAGRLRPSAAIGRAGPGFARRYRRTAWASTPCWCSSTTPPRPCSASGS